MQNVKVDFGINAGKVWKALDSNGSLTKNQMMGHTNLKPDELHAAIGWLAKENKIRKDGEFFQLDETNLNVKIGEDAGKIWKVIDIEKHDMNHLLNLTQMDERDVYTALGWLAKEGKLDNTKDEISENEVPSIHPEIDNLNDEIDALNADLATRNMIIKEITEQLTERQTQFIEGTGTIGKLREEIHQNKNKMKLMSDKLNERISNVTSLQEELEKDFTTPELTASTLFSKGKPLIPPEKGLSELNPERESRGKVNNFEEIDKSHDISENILKNKKSQIDES